MLLNYSLFVFLPRFNLLLNTKSENKLCPPHFAAFLFWALHLDICSAGLHVEAETICISIPSHIHEVEKRGC